MNWEERTKQLLATVIWIYLLKVCSCVWLLRVMGDKTWTCYYSSYRRCGVSPWTWWWRAKILFCSGKEFWVHLFLKNKRRPRFSIRFLGFCSVCCFPGTSETARLCQEEERMYHQVVSWFREEESEETRIGRKGCRLLIAPALGGAAV